MISANGGLPAHRYTPQVTQRWPRGSEPASSLLAIFFLAHFLSVYFLGTWMVLHTISVIQLCFFVLC